MSETATDELVEAVLGYASKGLPVFPCDQNKRPLTAKGFHDASTEPAMIRAWWQQRWPHAMVAMPTGAATGFFVVDVDDPEPFEAACTIDLPHTRRVDTQKGYHLYFRYEADKPVRNAQRHPKTGWPFPALPGAEVRGDGGYVIVPPSRHPQGKLYCWHDDATVQHAPPELLAILRKPRSEAKNGNAANGKTFRARVNGGGTAYGLAALNAECEAIRTARDGEQETALNEAALKIGALVAGGELEAQSAREALLDAALGMPSYDGRNPWTADQVTRKIDRGMADGSAHPRSAPDQSEQRDEKPAEDWPEPINLWARYQEPPLPLGLLPDVIERFAVKQGGIMGADPAGLAMAALAVCSAAIPDRVTLQVKRNDPTWQECTRLWVALVGPPSRKKTPIFKAAIAPLRSLDNNLMRAFTLAQAEYEALSASERKSAERPRQRRHLISDATVEAAQEVLRDSPDGVLSEQDELSGWFGAMDKHSPGKGAQADRGFWLKAFNGGTYNLNRIGRGASQIPNLSISLLGGIQPEPIRKLAAETVDDGLVQRLLPVALRPADVGRDEPSDGVVGEYERLIGKLTLMRPAMHQRAFGPEDQPVHFSPAAKAIRERLEREHLDLVTALETASPKLSAHFGKYDGLFARLALLWTCIEHADATMPPAEISEDVAARVAQFMADFIRPSAIAFYAGLLGMSAGHEELVALAALIVAKGLTEVKARDAQRSTQSFRAMAADEFRLICERLEAFGWLERGEPGPKSNTPRWIVNPRVHSMFADRAAEEGKRRKAAREALKTAIGG
jgi:hypothetical protein